MPANVTVELLMLNAAPLDCCIRRLQSKKVDEGTPLMTRDMVFLMITVDSLKMPELRLI